MCVKMARRLAAAITIPASATTAAAFPVGTTREATAVYSVFIWRRPSYRLACHPFPNGEGRVFDKGGEVNDLEVS